MPEYSVISNKQAALLSKQDGIFYIYYVHGKKASRSETTFKIVK